MAEPEICINAPSHTALRLAFKLYHSTLSSPPTLALVKCVKIPTSCRKTSESINRSNHQTRFAFLRGEAT